MPHLDAALLSPKYPTNHQKYIKKSALQFPLNSKTNVPQLATRHQWAKARHKIYRTLHTEYYAKQKLNSDQATNI